MTTKRNHGSGTLISRGTNKWLIKIDHPRNPVTQQRVRRSETFDGKKGAAQKRMTELLRERDHGTAVAPSKVTVGEWLNGWLVRRNAEGHLSGKTHERYSGIIHKHLIPRLGNVRLQALRADHVNDLKASWLSGHQSTSTAPLSGSTAHKHLVVLRQALADALTAGLITRNPMDSVTAPSPKVRTERRALTTGDITELLRAATGTRFEAPIRFTLATGLREGELLALHWSDVDFDRATANVHRTLHYVGGEVRFAQPKTKRSERTLELSATTLQRLRSHRAMQAELRLKVGPLWQERGLVFPSLIGTPWLPRAFYRDYRAVLAKSNIVNIEGVNWHTLRHTAATQWIAHDVDIFSVSRRLGHASAAFTMDVYGHLLKGQQRHASEALDHLLA